MTCERRKIKPIPVPGGRLFDRPGVARGRKQSTTVPQGILDALEESMHQGGYTVRKRHVWLEEALMGLFLRCPTISGPEVRLDPDWTTGPKVGLKVPVTPRMADDIRYFELFVRDCDRSCRAPIRRIICAAIAYRLRHPGQFENEAAIAALRAEYRGTDIIRMMN